MERFVENGMLLDFYGDLLTDHQKEVYEAAVYRDMSLSEIADEMGTSRQAVSDLIHRCDKILGSYEEKLHLMKKFLNAQQELTKIRELADPSAEDGIQRDTLAQIRSIADRLLEDF